MYQGIGRDQIFVRDAAVGVLSRVDLLLGAIAKSLRQSDLPDTICNGTHLYSLPADTPKVLAVIDYFQSRVDDVTRQLTVDAGLGYDLALHDAYILLKSLPEFVTCDSCQRKFRLQRIPYANDDISAALLVEYVRNPRR